MIISKSRQTKRQAEQVLSAIILVKISSMQLISLPQRTCRPLQTRPSVVSQILRTSCSDVTLQVWPSIGAVALTGCMPSMLNHILLQGPSLGCTSSAMAQQRTPECRSGWPMLITILPSMTRSACRLPGSACACCHQCVSAHAAVASACTTEGCKSLLPSSSCTYNPQTSLQL